LSCYTLTDGNVLPEVTNGFYGSQSSSQSGRCSALGFEAQAYSDYYSTPASPVRPQSQKRRKSHSCLVEIVSSI
uniref:CUB domain-containing protein n=1 Tax=Macrostomum lignano TaxID=282301 RepID=A0A1I8F4T7_9PLAT